MAQKSENDPRFFEGLKEGDALRFCLEDRLIEREMQGEWDSTEEWHIADDLGAVYANHEAFVEGLVELLNAAFRCSRLRLELDGKYRLDKENIMMSDADVAMRTWTPAEKEDLDSDLGFLRYVFVKVG